jgi:MYXO-CTERM domain-containing protein
MAAMVWLAPSVASAAAPTCTCQKAGVVAHADRADAVFTAQVTGSTTGTVGADAKKRQVRRFAATVDTVFQGKVATPDVLIVTPGSAGECGLTRIPPGQPWVFFVKGSGSKFFGNSCGGSERATSAHLLRVEKVLGAGRQLVDPTPDRPPLEYVDQDTAAPTPLTRLLAPGAALSLVGLLALAALRRRRGTS